MDKMRLAPLVIAACAILAPAAEASPQAPPPPAPGSLRGQVQLTGLAPVRTSWPVLDRMRALHTSDTFEDEAWLLGAQGELKNCVVTLTPADGSKLETKPMQNALLSKVGPRYVPRVLVVTNGTNLTFRNVDSPCQGFAFRSKRGPQTSMMIPAGGERAQVVDGKGPAPILCDMREYMRGVVYFTDTPFFAVTAADGTYTIDGVAPGRYRVRLWHEKLGFVNKEQKRLVTIASGAATAASWAVPSPRKPL